MKYLERTVKTTQKNLVQILMVDDDMIDQLNELAAQCEEIGTAADIL